MKDKKGVMIASQVFIYIMGMIVIIMVMVYGFKVIAGMRENSESIALINFQNSLSSTVTKLAIEYGSVTNKEFVVPPKYDRVCIIDQDETHPSSIPAYMHPIIYNFWQGDTPDNFFLINNDGVEPVFVGDQDSGDDMFRIEGDHWLCPAVVNGRIMLKITSEGNQVLLEDAR